MWSPVSCRADLTLAVESFRKDQWTVQLFVGRCHLGFNGVGIFAEWT